MNNRHVVVLGAGAWGSALAIQAARAGARVTLWARDPARAAAIEQSRRNPRLPAVSLPPGIQVVSGLLASTAPGSRPASASDSRAGADTGRKAASEAQGRITSETGLIPMSDAGRRTASGVPPSGCLADAAFLRSCDLLVLAVPTQHLRAMLGGMAPPAAPIAVCAKGIETASLRLPIEIVEDCVPGARAVVLTGPNFAHEIAAGQPGAAVVAGSDAAVRAHVVSLLSTASFRLYGNDDPIGAQIGGAAKNVIAIAAGAVIGAGLGENARAALITRGLAELGRLVAAMGGRAETVSGLSGLGDLLLTCTGPASRNYSLGVELGRGRTVAEILAERESVTEGVATAPALVARAEGLDLPVCRAVADLLTGRTTLAEAMANLLARPLRDE